jgi:DNA-binding response OmpR family regulator
MANPTILIIDDDDQRRDMFSDFLKLRGYSIVEAANGAAGVKTAHEIGPDLVITDLNMPGIDGTEVCRMLRDSENTTDVPIIIITGSSRDSKERVEGFRSGADDYISVPVALSELLERVRAQLR